MKSTATKLAHSMKAMGKKQRGLSLVEIILALGIVGGVAAVAVSYAGRADATSKRNEVTTALSEMVGTIKSTFGPSSSFATVTNQNIIRSGALRSPFKTTAVANVIEAPWGGQLVSSGAPATFAFVINGINERETCIAIANTFARFATKVHVGTAAAATTGEVSGGSAYKASAAAALDPTLLAAGCEPAGTGTGTIVAAEFR